MAVIHGNFYSKTLENGVQIEIALPEPIRDGAKEPLPVLYLLHGNSDDATVWQRRTSIERYADQYGMAVVMPGVQRGSAYTDQVNGEAWYTLSLIHILLKLIMDYYHLSLQALEQGAEPVSYTHLMLFRHDGIGRRIWNRVGAGLRPAAFTQPAGPRADEHDQNDRSGRPVHRFLGCNVRLLLRL